MFPYANKTNKPTIHKFWTYEYCQNFELKQEAIDVYKQKGKFYEDAQYFFEHMSTSPHPMFKFEKETVEPNIMSFSSIRVDINTLKILFSLLPNTKIITLKFSFNKFEYQNFEYLINQLMTKNTNIYNFIFEWNDEIVFDGRTYKMQSENDESPPEICLRQKSLIAKLGLHPRLDSLCLRGNFLGDDAGIILFEALKNNNSLRVLNVYRNCLSSRVIPSLVATIENNKKLEELNLGHNNFNDIDFKAISESLGKLKLTEEESEEHQKLLKEKQDAIEKNKKAKGNKKLEVPVPNVLDLEQIGDSFFVVKNTKIKHLNLMQNKFKEIYPMTVKILENTEDLLLVLDSKIFANSSKEQRDKIADARFKYSSKVFLVK